MKPVKSFYLIIISVVIFLAINSCSKKSTDTSGLYIPTNTDVTANATLQELEQGRDLYINNCSSCHSLFSPDAYTPAQWKSIINSMGPKTTMSASEILLVEKYVSRGN
jgi:mono/diheme cytochrome c family protein